MGGKHYNPFDDMDFGDADDGEEFDKRSSRRRGGGDEPEGVDVQVEKVVQERDKAIQVVLLDTGDMKWIPKSVIHADSEVYEKPEEGTGAGKLVIHRWWAEQEKLL